MTKNEDAPPVPLNEKVAWSYDDAAAALGLCRREVERLVAMRGGFPQPREYGRRKLLDPVEVREWFRALPRKGA